MQQSVDRAKRAFRRLLDEGATHAAVIELLVSLRREVDLAADDEGWALWNICDRYALLRDAQTQYAYQSEFHEWARAMLPSDRLHWVVSDGSQAATLIHGGFLEFWSRCYEFANDGSPRVPENRGARFESHRAAAAVYTRFREFRQAEVALAAIESLLAEDPTWPNRDFALATLETIFVDFFSAQGQRDGMAARLTTLEHHLAAWLAQAEPEDTPSESPLLGSWAQLNAPRTQSAIFVAIHNAACALARAGGYPSAERLFRMLLDRERSLTPYAQAQFLLSCWENRQDWTEIRDLLSASGRLTLEQLQEWAPALVEVVSA